MKRSIINTLILASGLLLTGCVTKYNLHYASNGAVFKSQNQRKTSVRDIEDERRSQSTVIGTIRGGYGNTLKRVCSDKSVEAAIRDVLETALEEHGLLDRNEESQLCLDVKINRLDANYVMNKEAHANLTFNLIDKERKLIVFSETYAADLTKRGFGAGCFANATSLGELANEALSQAIDNALSDRLFRSALGASMPR